AATGFVDQVIAALSDSSAEDPTDPDIATNLGSAYVTKLRGENVTSLERRELTQEAMVQFDRALKLDGEHWEARFSKSMMQVFAPAALGLQVRAESNLGLLLEQQRTRPQQPEHAHTYFFLSNLYANQGQGSKSQALRQEASSLFPNDKRFR
ncbi:MAG: tetratricopeptide (TPR) repeat protein, partial [Planctomycetota bacterium]